MTDNAELQSVPINPTARIVFNALEQMGWSVENFPQLVERIKRLDRGIPAEDEFAVLISWMGKCELVHKLEQEQSPPESQNVYRIPDLLAFFRHNNHLFPVLIEVKKHKAEKLSWKPEYLDSLRQYAATLNLPLLVAWKWEPFGFWTLFEAKHFSKTRKNYEITQELTMKENLMSLLAGDFAVGLHKGVGFHFVVRKGKELESGDSKNSDTKTWLARVEKAFFTNGRGERIKELGPGLWSLLLCAHLEEHTEVSESKASSSFIIEEESIQFTHRMLPVLLQSEVGKDKPLRWREVRQNYSVPIKFQILRKAATDESSADIVATVIEVAPNTKPDFLSYE